MADHTVNIRELILEILLDISKNGAYSHIALAGVLDKYQYLDKKERAFLTRVTEGTLENQISIDYILDHFSKVPVHKMKPAIRCILRSAVYQLRYMDAVPDAAACNEAVRLAQKKGFRNLSGFVNGILRNISRNKNEPAWPDREKQPETYLSVRYSMPEWIIRLWREEFPFPWETAVERMLQVFQTPSPLTIRTDTSRITTEELIQRLAAEGVRAVRMEALPYALQITGYDYLAALPSFQEGLFYVQDMNSMFVAEAANPREQDTVVDICAAPGGKCIQIAQMMRGTGHVIARDLTEYKVNLLRENIDRCRIANIRAEVRDARILDESLYEKADIVIADLPCSGLGVMRRKKDIRYRMTPEKMKELVSLQREILNTACHYVKPGGRMIYSTCTVHKAENEENAQWFAGGHSEFILESSRQLLPGDAGGDGFYIAQFRRRASGSAGHFLHHKE